MVGLEPLESLQLQISSEGDPLCSGRSEMLQLEPNRGIPKAHTHWVGFCPGVSSKNWSQDFAHKGGGSRGDRTDEAS